MRKLFERRDSVRYTVVENQALIAWSEGEESLQTSAYLKSISQSGALLVAEKRVRRDAGVWVRLEQPASTEWTQANVVEVSKAPGLFLFRKPRFHIRLRFSAACPYEVFKAATHGKSLNARAQEAVSPEFDNRDWR